MIRLLFAFALALVSPLAAAAETAKPADGNVYVRFKPIIVTLVQDDRPTGLVSVTLTLKAANPAGRDAIEEQRPRYVDAFTRTMILMGQTYIDPRRPLDVPLIADALQKAADQAVRGGKARVLLVDANTRLMLNR
jgi:hypothetical protein